jgi:hypothetical protein
VWRRGRNIMAARMTALRNSVGADVLENRSPPF